MPCSTSNDGHQRALLKQWETLLDAVPAMVFFKDPQNRFLHVNRAYAEAVGLPKEEIIGRAVGDFLSDARRVEAYWQDDREVIESGRPKRNITAPHITDSRRWLRTEKLPVRDRDDRIIGVVGLSVDISDLKRTELQLEDLTAKLIEAQEKERQRIFLALHDELGQSLALLKLRVRAVQMRLDPGQADLGADCRQILGDISAVIDNVRRLCHDLTPAALEDIGLNAALQWLCEDFARHFGFDLVVHLDKVDHIFRRDAQLLIYRIFQEALTNARKHAGATRVWVTLVRCTDAVVCTVADNGKGLPAGCNVKRRSPGDGLGLAAMGERARMLGGRMILEARPGGGTCVRVTISLDKEPETDGDLPNRSGR